MTPKIELLKGDALDLLPSLAARDIAAVITDPPYCSGGMQATGRMKQKDDGGYNPVRDRWILGDSMSTEVYRDWLRKILRMCMDSCVDGGQAFVFTDWRMWPVVQYAGETAGWTTAQMVVWDKTIKGMGRFWMNQHELVWCGFKNKRQHPKSGQGNLWRGGKPKGQLHPNAKPVGLIRYLLESVAVDGAVLDPFMGTGSVGVAARMSGRDFIGIDVDGEWIDEARANVLNAAIGARQQALGDKVI